MERSEKNMERSTKKKERSTAGKPERSRTRRTGPPGNKNAVTTGEFETLLFDCLEPEEKQLAAAVPNDKEQLLFQEIQLLTVRERSDAEVASSNLCRWTLQRFPENPESKREK